MQKVVSSKFAAKMQILEKLSELPDLVPCEHIDIPDEIIEYHNYFFMCVSLDTIKSSTQTIRWNWANEKPARTTR